MKIFYSDLHFQHAPAFEVFDGGVRVPTFEVPERAERILAALRKTGWAEIHPPIDFGLDSILAVHDRDYVEFLASAWTEWLATDPEAESATDKSALLPATFALRGQAHRPKSLLGRAGYYMMDLSAPIVAGTYAAALASANCALSAAQAITHTTSTFALCRPPGHHAGKSHCGGYCYFNNAAIAAHWLSAHGKVTLLDIDYHAGNGTQDIFYERGDVLSISIHADPAFEYPYYAGYAEERGAGAGLGFHHNFPLPAGTGDEEYLTTLNAALHLIREFQPTALVISAGMDIYSEDPLGKIRITREGIRQIGARIAELRLPTAIIMEGGYNNDALGDNVVAFLGEFE
ncbi:MAG: histone deacetylase family protein [Chloroflexi bacterium]|nr:histone deacetylase family protein [Chloroflexota bacterium]